MIAGCGTDIVAVDRLERWCGFADERLYRVFTLEEIAVIRIDGVWCVQRAAAYFALKEAFYKALSNALVRTGKLEHAVLFASICPLINVIKNEWGIPELVADWEAISKLAGFDCSWKVHCSYAHEKLYAVAYVILV